MHAAALQLSPILGAEKSKVPFYIAGGLLVAWALILSIALGMRRPKFPGGLVGERIVITISCVLVLGALSTAVLTSGAPAKAGESTQSTAGAPASSSGAPAGTPAPPSGASGTAPSSSATTSLKLAANPTGQLAYDAKSLRAKAGKVTIGFTNAAPLEHNVTIGQGSAVLGATPTFRGGGERTITLTLKAGTYTFYCSVPGHRQAGMEGTLNVS